MPFVNSAQRRACLYQQQNDISRGSPVKWNCEEMAKVRYAGRLRKIYVTERGAHYVLVKGKKVYVYDVY